MLSTRNREKGCFWDLKKQLTQMDDIFVLGHEEERGSMIPVGFYTWWRREQQIVKRIWKPEILAAFVQDRKGKRKKEMMNSKTKLLFVIISFNVINCFSTLIFFESRSYTKLLHIVSNHLNISKNPYKWEMNQSGMILTDIFVAYYYLTLFYNFISSIK